jgi:hypothetical protein
VAIAPTVLKTITFESSAPGSPKAHFSRVEDEPQRRRARNDSGIQRRSAGRAPASGGVRDNPTQPAITSVTPAY